MKNTIAAFALTVIMAASAFANGGIIVSDLNGNTKDNIMTPAASVSGFFLSHPESTYFNVGKIGEDQLQDMARRRGITEQALQRLLAPNL